MSIFTRITAWIMMALSFIFPWLGGSESADPYSYIIEDKTITIYVPANPSTGFMWEYDANGINFKSSAYKAESYDEELCGGSGATKFVFEADGEGEFEITLQYLRPWEDSLPGRKVIINGSVDKNGQITVTKFEY